jgi:phage terminase large subunit
VNGSTALTNPALWDFWDKVFIGGADTAVLHGGRSSSKTRDTACQLVRLVNHVRVRMRVLCIRRFQNRIQDSVYTELKWAIAHLGLTSEYEVQKTTIIHRATGSEFIFYGIERNIEDIKGTSDVDILWVEEAEKLTEDQWVIIGPTIRKEDSLAILLFNPKFVTDYVWKNFVVNTPPHTVVHKIDYTENPFLSQKALRDIAAMKERDPETFEHVYVGVPLGDSELSIFKRRWLDACVDAHEKLGLVLVGRNVIGFDPADDGEDKCATVDKIGGVFTDASDWASGKDELVQNAKSVWARAKQAGASVSYDTIGVGAFVGGYIDEQNELNGAKVSHYAFHAGGAVMDPDDPSDPFNANSPLNRVEYLNLKAQAWAGTARRAMLTFNAVVRGQSIRPEDVLSFSSKNGTEKLDALFTELCVPWWVESEGKKRVVPKAKLKKDLGVKSHNLADALIAADNIFIVGTYTLDNV